MDTHSQENDRVALKKQIDRLIALCHRYGTTRFVSCGGGNVSWKNKSTLWIKASGTYLSEADETTLVAVKREPLGDLYRTPAPADPNEREAWANQIVQSAVKDKVSSGRPSVETPLHDLFDTAYVVPHPMRHLSTDSLVREMQNLPVGNFFRTPCGFPTLTRVSRFACRPSRSLRTMSESAVLSHRSLSCRITAWSWQRMSWTKLTGFTSVSLKYLRTPTSASGKVPDRQILHFSHK